MKLTTILQRSQTEYYPSCYLSVQQTRKHMEQLLAELTGVFASIMPMQFMNPGFAK